VSARLRRLVALGTLTVGLVACNALNSIGPEICRRPIDDVPICYSGGEVVDGVYTTSGWDGELLYLPGGEFYQLRHGLGAIPQVVIPYVAFNGNGITTTEGDGGAGEERPGSLAPATGNQVEIKRVTDEYIEVLNGSCVDYYLRVVAFGAAGGAPRAITCDDDGAGGSGGSGGAGGMSDTGMGGAGGSAGGAGGA
jgi:uncharacterized membrane protein YgcG